MPHHRHLVQRLLELLVRGVLQHETTCPGPHGAFHGFGTALEREGQSARARSVVAQPSDGLVAVHHGHVQVHHDNGNAFSGRLQGLDEFRAVAGIHHHLVRRHVADHGGQHVAQQRVVIDQRDGYPVVCCAHGHVKETIPE